MPVNSRPSAADVKLKVTADAVSLSGGVYTVRKGYFYSHGGSEDALAKRITDAYPHAVILLDKGDVWKTFRGGAPVAQQTHWWVKFTFPSDELAEAKRTEPPAFDQVCPFCGTYNDAEENTDGRITCVNCDDTYMLDKSTIDLLKKRGRWNPEYMGEAMTNDTKKTAAFDKFVVNEAAGENAKLLSAVTARIQQRFGRSDMSFESIPKDALRKALDLQRECGSESISVQIGNRGAFVLSPDEAEAVLLRLRFARQVPVNEDASKPEDSFFASDLNWPPGEWRRVAIIKGTRYNFTRFVRDNEGDITHAIYIDTTSGRTITVFND
jgi:hypothetical protein